MRDIDSKTRECVDYFESGCFGNTMVSAKDDEVSVYLHANFIFMRKMATSEIFTLAGWNTNTTRNRLNAVLSNGHVVQRNYMPFLVVDGKAHEIDENKYYKYENGEWSVSDSLFDEFEPLEWSVA